MPAPCVSVTAYLQVACVCLQQQRWRRPLRIDDLARCEPVSDDYRNSSTAAETAAWHFETFGERMKPFPASSIVSIVSVALAIVAVGSTATAQTDTAEPPRLELWGGISGVIAGPAGALVSSYAPPLLFDGDFTSLAGQTLNIDTGFAVGMTAGLNVFPSRRIGLQVLVDRASCDVFAPNGAYTVTLQYVSRQPPSGQPQIVNVNQSTAWANTSGSLTQTAIGFNLVVRIGRPDRMTVTVSGGPSYYRFGGGLQPLAFTAFWLGGHSVLFEDDYRLALSLKPTHGLGFNAGGDLSSAMGRHAAIIFGYRYFGGQEKDIGATPTVILNAGELTAQQPIADVSSRLALAPLRVSVSGSRVFVGLKLLR
jgi:hypothetical protein